MLPIQPPILNPMSEELDEAVAVGAEPTPEVVEEIKTDKVPEPIPMEQALIITYTAMVQVPPFLENWYLRFDMDRKYVNEECLLLDSPEVVATNYILRNQIVLLANLYARDPAISWKPGPTIGEHPPLLSQYAKTLEIFCAKMAEETELRRLIRGGIQDASTVGHQIFKLNPQEDPKLDPLGARRQNDQLDNIARYQWLLKRKAETGFSADSALAKEILDLQQVVMKYAQDKIQADMINNPPPELQIIDPMTGMPMLDPLTGQPMLELDPEDLRVKHLALLEAGQMPPDLDVGEIERYIGFNLDPVQAEDFRFDWTCSQPERLYECQWMAHRVYMDYDQFGAAFDVLPEELSSVLLYGTDGRQISQGPRWTKVVGSSSSAYDSEGPQDRRTIETTTNMNRCAVWELWHKGQGRVFVWAEGMNRFLRNTVPTIVGRRWYPFYMLPFNRVTGRILPLSDTMLTRQLQNELNRRRTMEAEAQKAAFPRIFIKRGSMEPGEKEMIENSQPYQVIELTSPGDVKQAFSETAPLPFNAELYRRDETRMELEMMSGVSRNAAGSPGGDLATTAAIANEQMGVQTDFRRALVEELIFDIMYDFAYMGIQFIPEENIKRICGSEAYWPMLERETFLRYLKLDVRAGSTGRPDTAKSLATMEKFAQVATALGLPVDGEAILEDMMYDMGKNDWKRYLLTPEKMMMRALQGQPPAGGGAGAPGQQDPSGGDGRPPMNEDPMAPEPGSIPGPNGPI